MAYFNDPYFDKCYCRICGERISFEEFGDNDGLCDECYDEVELDYAYEYLE